MFGSGLTEGPPAVHTRPGLQALVVHCLKDTSWLLLCAGWPCSAATSAMPPRSAYPSAWAAQCSTPAAARQVRCCARGIACSPSLLSRALCPGSHAACCQRHFRHCQGSKWHFNVPHTGAVPLLGDCNGWSGDGCETPLNTVNAVGTLCLSRTRTATCLGRHARIVVRMGGR